MRPPCTGVARQPRLPRFPQLGRAGRLGRGPGARPALPERRARSLPRPGRRTGGARHHAIGRAGRGAPAGRRLLAAARGRAAGHAPGPLGRRAHRRGRARPDQRAAGHAPRRATGRQRLPARARHAERSPAVAPARRRRPGAQAGAGPVAPAPGPGRRRPRLPGRDGGDRGGVVPLHGARPAGGACAVAGDRARRRAGRAAAPPSAGALRMEQPVGAGLPLAGAGPGRAGRAPGSGPGRRVAAALRSRAGRGLRIALVRRGAAPAPAERGHQVAFMLGVPNARMRRRCRTP